MEKAGVLILVDGKTADVWEEHEEYLILASGEVVPLEKCEIFKDDFHLYSREGEKVWRYTLHARFMMPVTAAHLAS